MSQSQDGREAGRRAAAEQVAMHRAGREQAEAHDARSSVLGEVSVGNRQITAEEANELKRGAASEGIDAAAVVDFTRNLADLAAAPDEPGLREEEEKEVEAAIAKTTAVAEEVEAGVEEPNPDGEKQQLRNKAGRRGLASEKKTSAMGGGDDAVGPIEPDTPSIPAPVEDTVDGLPVVTVVPRKRKSIINLDAILIAGRDAGILPAYMRHRAEDAVLAQTSREFTHLFHALNLCGGSLAKAFVLKAMLVHRPCSALVPFAESLATAGRDEVAAAAPGPEAPDEPPLDSNVAQLRLFWDPLAVVGVDKDWARCLDEESTSDPWSVPKWMRGVPRAPLDLGIVALDLALQGVLEPGGSTDGGSGDALAKAWEAEGAAHPALRRWLLSLAARAETRDGLLAAREVMMRARAEMSRPWSPPSRATARQPWR